MNIEEKNFYKQLWELYLIYYNILKNQNSTFLVNSFFSPEDVKFFLTFTYNKRMYLTIEKFHIDSLKQVVHFYKIGSQGHISYTLHRGYRLIDSHQLQEYFLQKIQSFLLEMV